MSLNDVPPIDSLRTDDPSAADPARIRLSQKTSFIYKAFSLPNLRRHGATDSSSRAKKKGKEPQQDHIIAGGASIETSAAVPYIQLPDNPSLPSDLPDDQDIYKWAVVYENQRGAMILSSAKYSQFSLLPIDPPPFTMPEVDGATNHQPQVSLSEYPLPDGTWRWVSKSWMIDMRGGGEVSHDGFEYNWFFRRHHWRAEVGTCSAGGWVRRRRWVRLMMRPAKVLTAQDIEVGVGHSASVPSLRPTDEVTMANEVWKGDGKDWERCHALMKRLRDGKKVEVWRRWSGFRATPGGSRVSDATGEKKASILPSREHIATVLAGHGNDLLQMFVYPQSRAEFIELLEQSGLLSESQSQSPSPSPTIHTADFWSYKHDLSDASNHGKE